MYHLRKILSFIFFLFIICVSLLFSNIYGTENVVEGMTTTSTNVSIGPAPSPGGHTKELGDLSDAKDDTDTLSDAKDETDTLSDAKDETDTLGDAKDETNDDTLLTSLEEIRKSLLHSQGNGAGWEGEEEHDNIINQLGNLIDDYSENYDNFNLSGDHDEKAPQGNFQ